MKAFFIILLVAACAVFGYLWLDTDRKAEEQIGEAETEIQQLNEEVKTTQAKLVRETTTRQELEQQVSLLKTELGEKNTNIVNFQAEIQRLEQEAVEAAKAAEAFEKELAQKDQQISNLEVEKTDLTEQMNQLNGKIAQLESKIGDYEEQLAAAEGDRTFLLAELKRMQTEKAELERQFTDLALLREQVRRLQTELAVARRVDLLRRGSYGGQQMKGAQLLKSKRFSDGPEETGDYDLDVEIRADGTTPVVRTNESPTVTPLD